MTSFLKFQDCNFDASRPDRTMDLASIDAISGEMAVRLYTEMVRLRVMEEELIREYHPADEMRCPSHFCIGQEAAPAALSLLIEPEDYLFSHLFGNRRLLREKRPAL